MDRKSFLNDSLVRVGLWGRTTGPYQRSRRKSTRGPAASSSSTLTLVYCLDDPLDWTLVERIIRQQSNSLKSWVQKVVSGVINLSNGVP